MAQTTKTQAKPAPAAKAVKPAARKSAAALPLKKLAAPAAKQAPVTKPIPAAKPTPAAKPAPVAKPAPAPAQPTAPETKAVAKPAAAAPVAVAKPAPMAKVVRDGFTMPQVDYDLLKTLKAQCLKAGVEVKKSELLRAGVLALAALPEAQLLERVRALAPVKTGRKKKKA